MSVQPTFRGLSLTFSGFNEHLLALARLVLPRLSRAADSAAFEMARRQLILELQDVTSQQPPLAHAKSVPRA